VDCVPDVLEGRIPSELECCRPIILGFCAPDTLKDDGGCKVLVRQASHCVLRSVSSDRASACWAWGKLSMSSSALPLRMSSACSGPLFP
jgi:hypothetical protein